MSDIQIMDQSGKVVRRSRNLRGIVEHLRNRLIRSVTIRQLNTGVVRDDGELCIIWEDGTRVVTTFASFSVLCDWVCARTWMEGVQATVNSVLHTITRKGLVPIG